MTTAVTIKMTTPLNDKDIMVDIIDGPYNVGTDNEIPAAVNSSIRVRDGEETEVYVHDARLFNVREVDKEVALGSEEATEGTDNAEPAVAGSGDSDDAEEVVHEAGPDTTED